MKTKALYGILCIVLSVLSACSVSVGNAANTIASNVNQTTPEPAGTPSAGSAESQAAAAAALVADLYKQHDAQKGPFFQTRDRALVDKYFAKPLADLIWKDANNSSGEVGAIDGDPLYNAQDIEIKGFAVGRADVKDETAKVVVTFTNFGEKKAITHSLRLISGAWKIENVLYSEKDSLLKWLRETYTEKSESKPVSSEFEGRFQVGDTSCTVKPIKMAFEVRWAKGKGAETFVFAEGFTFESVPDKGEPNRFEFDDENYTTGTFYRADGETFPVRRLK